MPRTAFLLVRAPRVCRLDTDARGAAMFPTPYSYMRLVSVCVVLMLTLLPSPLPLPLPRRIVVHGVSISVSRYPCGMGGSQP